MRQSQNRFLGAVIIITGLMASCKKTDVKGDTLTTPSPTSSSNLKDTALSYTRDIYLWADKIPASVTASSFTDLSAMMTGIRQYSIEPGFNGPVDRWSFAVKQAEWDKVSSGVAGDFGLGVFFRSESDLRVKSVEAASPAGRAGIHRGWRIVKLNGSSNISTSNTDLVVKAVFEASNTTFTFQKPDGSNVDITLNAATYQENPVILDSVYAVAGKKIGYFVFNSFLGDTTQIYNSFNRIFSKFSSFGLNDVIIDLRYNGGGYVSIQEKLANYLAPLSANGQLMMKQQFNAANASYNSTDYFHKLGALNLSRIFFIVSKSTASASELLINNLKPYMDVILVGPGNTYGKPVGFFPIPVGDEYIFPVSFKTTNKNGDGSYFNGLTLNKSVADGLDKDWGDLAEGPFAKAVSYITTGDFGTIAGRENVATPAAVLKGNATLDLPAFKGAIDTRGLTH
ncbi:MAG: hypothetical protein JWP88_784 [Flaviaesturariibacter sp.]|nr:hypothetical protein [Flaviaesturariibacter sp.]